MHHRHLQPRREREEPVAVNGCVASRPNHSHVTTVPHVSGLSRGRAFSFAMVDAERKIGEMLVATVEASAFL